MSEWLQHPAFQAGGVDFFSFGDTTRAFNLDEKTRVVVSGGVALFERYPRGFIYGGANGGVGQYVEGRGFCDPMFPVSGVIHGIHVLGERVVVVQKYLENGIAILEPND